MKNIVLSIVLLMGINVAANAQDKKVVEDKLKVSGICGMCKERIENALDRPGVKFAEWDVKTHILSIAYRSDKISEQQIHECLAAIGHDTEKLTALDSAYLTVDDCCRYRDPEVVKQHEIGGGDDH